MTTVEGDAPKDGPTGQRIRRVRIVVIALLTLAVLTVAVWQTVAHLTLGSVRIDEFLLREENGPARRPFR